MSMISKTSTQGIMKKTPGPLAPSDKSSPRRKMTARSYSFKKYLNFVLIYHMESYLNYLDCKEKGEREGYNDKKEGADDHQVSNNALTFLTS